MSIFYSSAKRQKGNFLFESMIAVVLTGVIGAGMAQIGSRVSVAHHELRANGLVVTQLREKLSESGSALCGSSGSVAFPNGRTAAVNYNCASSAPDLVVTPSVVAPGAPTSLTVQSVKTVKAEVDLAQLGIAGASTKLVIGTHQ